MWTTQLVSRWAGRLGLVPFQELSSILWASVCHNLGGPHSRAMTRLWLDLRDDYLVFPGIAARASASARSFST
jgi:hypothetical protein